MHGHVKNCRKDNRAYNSETSNCFLSWVPQDDTMMFFIIHNCWSFGKIRAQ